MLRATQEGENPLARMRAPCHVVSAEQSMSYTAAGNKGRALTMRRHMFHEAFGLCPEEVKDKSLEWESNAEMCPQQIYKPTVCWISASPLFSE